MSKPLAFALFAALLSGCALFHPRPDPDRSAKNLLSLTSRDVKSPVAAVFVKKCPTSIIFLRSDDDRAGEEGCMGFMAHVTVGLPVSGLPVTELPLKALPMRQGRRDLKDAALAGAAKYRVVIDHHEGLIQNPGSNQFYFRAFAYVYENATGRFVQKTTYDVMKNISFTDQALALGQSIGQSLVADLTSAPEAAAAAPAPQPK
jgi:hypothetical protein